MEATPAEAAVDLHPGDPPTGRRCLDILRGLGLTDPPRDDILPRREGSPRSPIDMIRLYPDMDIEGTRSIVLTVHAGRTPDQARALYEGIREKAVSQVYGDWIFIPEPILAGPARQVMLETDLHDMEYIRRWRAVWRETGLAEGMPDPADELERWTGAGLISGVSRREASRPVMPGDRRAWMVCPGLCLKHLWDGIVARDLEMENAFSDCVRERTREALDILGAAAR
jgi:hypothetical protein